MTTIKQYNRFGEDLERFLLLRSSPLAIKILKNEADVPEGAIRPKRDRGIHIALCQAFALSRREKHTVAMLKEDQWCWGPLVAFGLVDPVVAESEEPTRQQLPFLPRLEYRKYAGIVSAPLKSANFKPDLALVYSNTAQLRSLLMAVKHMENSLVNSQFDPIDSCVYSIIPVLQTGQYRITLPDPGESHRALAGEDEIIFSIPANKLKTVLSGLEHLENIQQGYTDCHIEMRPDFPQPAFYQRLFKAWGLDEVK
jgi:uncharacterized protein (DUF169 family)